MRLFTQFSCYLAFVFFCTIGQAQSSGIQFFDGTWEDVLAEAKAQDQLIFVDAYTDWCGPCKMMSRNTFPNKEVGEFFGNKFVSYKFNMEKGEGPEFADRYQVTAYPSLLFINYEGELVHRALGYKGPLELIKVGENALSPAKNKTTLQLAYEAGTTNPNKLYDYAITLLQMGEDHREVAGKYFATQSTADLLSSQNWEAIKALTQEIDSREFQYLLKKQNKFVKLFGSKEVQEKIREVCEFNTIAAAAEGQPAKYRSALNVAMKELDDKGETASRLRLSYAEATEDWQDYAFKALIHFENYTITDAEELSRAAWYFYEHVHDERHLDKAATWIKQATVIENTYKNQKIYAYVLFKSGDLRLALPTAYKAQAMAEKERIDTEEMEALIQNIKAQSNK